MNYNYKELVQNSLELDNLGDMAAENDNLSSISDFKINLDDMEKKFVQTQVQTQAQTQNLNQNSELKSRDSFQILLDAIRDKRNILMHGPGGCGKTYNIMKLQNHPDIKYKEIFYTALTGAAAINIPRAMTLHRWAGIGLGKDTAYNLANAILKNKLRRLIWQQTEILIIDEVSMMGESLFDKLDEIGKIVRKNNQPFGGIQLILSGDFLQLPPVNDEFCFRSKRFANLNLLTIKLEDMRRYDDSLFFSMLLRARIGALTDDDRLNLEKRLHFKLGSPDLNSNLNLDFRPTILYSKRIDTNAYNMVEFDKLDGPTFTFEAQISNGAHSDAYEEIIPLSLQLKIHTQVMLKVNLDVEQKLINGSRGVVVGFQGKSVKVLFPNAKPKNLEVIIEPHVWEIRETNKVVLLTQIPLIMAWALTIHKSQGATLDFVECDLGDSIFADGQAYVALSRVRNYESLILKNFKEKKIRASREALNFINSIL